MKWSVERLQKTFVLFTQSALLSQSRAMINTSCSHSLIEQILLGSVWKSCENFQSHLLSRIHHWFGTRLHQLIARMELHMWLTHCGPSGHEVCALIPSTWLPVCGITVWAISCLTALVRGLISDPARDLLAALANPWLKTGKCGFRRKLSCFNLN